MTSNIGSQVLLENVKDTGDITEETEKAVMDSLHAFFKPEILNRMDDIVLFKPLSINDMSMIVDKILTQKYTLNGNVFLLIVTSLGEKDDNCKH